MAHLKPCPFCGSSRIREDVHLFHGDAGEFDVDVIECLNCDAVAPKSAWNSRMDKNEPAR